MKYNRLGKSPLQVSQISLGCMSLKDPVVFPQVVQQAIDLGINFFDTADLYEQGKNEEMLGAALGNQRHHMVIATKVGNQWNTDGTSWQWNPRKEYILTAVNDSLRRLKTDYIDLYQLHGGTLEDPIDETIEAFEILLQQGKIRAYGISSIRPNVIREYVQKSAIASVMMQYSLLDRRPEEACLQLLQENNISVITRGTIAKGLLAGKATQAYLGHSSEVVKTAAEVIQTIAHKNNCTSATTTCQYVLQSATVASAVMGFRTLEQLQNCVDGQTLSPLDQHDYQTLQQSVPAKVYDKHR